MAFHLHHHLVPLVVLILLGVVTTTSWGAEENKLINVTKLEMFVDELPDMPKLHGFHVVNGVPVSRSLRIGMFKIDWKFHRDIPATPVFAYGTSKKTATVPGPTIEALHGIDTHVTWTNHLPKKHILPWDPTIPTAMPRMGGIPTVVHLHGAINEPESDGNSNSWFTSGFGSKGPTWTKKKYHYSNNQHPGNMWYHDHAMGLTRVNLLAGLIGSYTLRHPEVEAPLGLPSGDEFDRTLMVLDRSFNRDGTLYMNHTGNNPDIHPQWQPEYFGDAIVVNGKAWPYMSVRRRKYRFRVINASNARFFRFFFRNGLKFVVVGADSAYLEKPVKKSSILLAPSEIVDVVIDFSRSNTSTAILSNDAAFPYPDGDGGPINEMNGSVMKFLISKRHEHGKSKVPENLIQYPSPDVSSAAQTRYIAMYEYASEIDEPTHLYLNNKSYEEPATETPKVGTSEVWYIINLTDDNHPLHVHLGLFRVLEQTKIENLLEFKNCMNETNDAIKCQINKHATGHKVEVPQHEKGWKNVFKMRPKYVTKILVRFSYVHTDASYSFDATAEPGYVYHCHILDHEDNAMMRPLKFYK